MLSCDYRFPISDSPLSLLFALLDLNLTILDLTNNQFTGALPPTLGLCSSLQDLSLGGNQFSGELPHVFGNLQQLLTLNLKQNMFVCCSAQQRAERER